MDNHIGLKQISLKQISYVLILILFMMTLWYYSVVYSAARPGSFSAQEFLDNPMIASGDHRLRSIMGTYSSTFPGGFFLTYNHQQVKVLFSPAYDPPRFGETMVYGTFHSDGSIQAVAVHNYNYNYFLYFFSFFAGIFVIFIFYQEWKITLHGIEERGTRGKKNA